MRTCTKCLLEKDDKDFVIRNVNDNIFHKRCKNCMYTTPEKSCPICGVKFRSKGTNKACSIKCRIILHSVKDKNGCWIWSKMIYPNGYGRIYVQGNYVLAHRASYEAFRGLIPKGKCVCHKCDNHLCINPNHLWIGTHEENMQDCRQKHRNVHGERSPECRLTDCQIEEMRSLWNESFSIERLKRIFNCSTTHIKEIVKFQTRARKTVHPELIFTSKDNVTG